MARRFLPNVSKSGLSVPAAAAVTLVAVILSTGSAAPQTAVLSADDADATTASKSDTTGSTTAPQSASELDLLGDSNEGDTSNATTGDETTARGLLRPSLDALGQRSAVRPVARSQSAALPATGQIPQPVDREGEARKAYDPNGIALGDFVINASTTTTIGRRHDNQGGNETYLSDIGEIRGRSDWEANSVDFLLRGGYLGSVAGTSERTPEGDARINGRFDLNEAERLSGSLGWSLRDDDDYDDSVVNTFSASGGYDRAVGLIGLRTSLSADRTIYAKGRVRDNTALSGELRLSLDNGAVVRPFVEGGLFGRLYDDTGAGDDRSGFGGEAKGGVAFSSGTLDGELAVGYAYESIRDPSLPDIRGVIVEGTASWKATELTTVDASLTSSFDTTGVAGASGKLTRTGELTVTQAVAPNAYVYGGGKLSFENVVGTGQKAVTTTLRGGVGYEVNRHLEVGLAASHKIVDSNQAGGDSRESRVEAFVTLRQ